MDLVRAIRDRTDAAIRVDANGGWSLAQAKTRITALEPLGIQFVEQPLPPGNLSALRELRSQVHLPIIADEDAHDARSVARLGNCVDGVNIKLMECGGLREALRMIHVARAYGMSVMIGCMMESSLSLTAAAHLSPLADYGDLDSELLIDNDPFTGFTLQNGKIILPTAPGIGVTRRAASANTRAGA